MADREVGPGKTYGTISDAYTAANAGDDIVCFFDTTDTSFILCAKANITVKKADGFTPIWANGGTLVNIQATPFTIEDVKIGRNDNASGTLFAANAQDLTGIVVNLTRCPFTFGTSSPSVVGGAHPFTEGEAPITLNMTNCSMNEPTNKLGTLLRVSGTSATLTSKGHLNITDCDTIRCNGLRAVAAWGLFESQAIDKTILQIYSSNGLASDFDSVSTSTIWQSVLDGMTTATTLVTCDGSKTTLDIKNSYIMRSNSTAISTTNCSGDLIQNSSIYFNVTAGINNASTITKNCLLGNNGSDYTGGGAPAADDIVGAPTFNDLASDDYTPTSGSDTRNAGIDMLFTTDIRGEAIPQGADFDIGPYEYPEVSTVQLTTATATDKNDAGIVATGDLTDAIATPAEWTVTADKVGVLDPVISTIVIGVPNTTAEITFVDDLTPREDYTIVTTSAFVEAGHRILYFTALTNGARMVSANINSVPNTILIMADLLLTAASDGADKWSIETVNSFGNDLTITGATVQGGSSMLCALTYTGIPTPGAKYKIDTTSTDFEVGYTTAYAVVALGDQDFTPEPLLPTLLTSIGKQIAYNTGTPQTVLTSSLDPSDTTIYVESTQSFPDENGTVYIGGIGLAYTTKTDASFTGVIWPTVTVPGYGTPFVIAFDTFSIGEVVTDYSQQYSLQDEATNERIISRTYGTTLKRLLNNKGFPVPLATMTDSDIQNYGNERSYQDTGTWQSVFRTLRPVLYSMEPNGTAVVTAGPYLKDVEITDNIQQDSLIGRWMEVNGFIGRILTVTAGSAANLYDITFLDYNGLMWENPNLDLIVGETVTWRLLLYTMHNQLGTTTWKAAKRTIGPQTTGARFLVTLYMGNIPAVEQPVGYWLADNTVDMPGGGVVATDGRSMNSYFASDSSVIATADDNYIYLIDNYDFEITSLTSELLPAAVLPIVNVY